MKTFKELLKKRLEKKRPIEDRRSRTKKKNRKGKDGLIADPVYFAAKKNRANMKKIDREFNALLKRELGDI